MTSTVASNFGHRSPPEVMDLPAIDVVASNPAGGSTTYDSSKVNRAVAQLRSVFSDGTAWKSELEAGARTVASLEPAERRSFVNLLASETSANGSQVKQVEQRNPLRQPGTALRRAGRRHSGCAARCVPAGARAEPAALVRRNQELDTLAG